MRKLIVARAVRTEDHSGEPYAVLELNHGSPFHYMASGSRGSAQIHLFKLAPEDLRELAFAASTLADELEQAQSQEEQPQRPIEEVK
jgi:hypothetical protein